MRCGDWKVLVPLMWHLQEEFREDRRGKDDFTTTVSVHSNLTAWTEPCPNAAIVGGDHHDREGQS